MGKMKTKKTDAIWNRSEYLRIAKKNFGKKLETDFMPESFGYHELMHLVWVQAEVFENYILSHPTTILYAEMFTKASEICEAMYDFYQMVGRADSDNGGEKP